MNETGLRVWVRVVVRHRSRFEVRVVVGVKGLVRVTFRVRVENFF